LDHVYRDFWLRDGGCGDYWVSHWNVTFLVSTLATKIRKSDLAFSKITLLENQIVF